MVSLAWQPKASDLTWTKNLFSMIREGGVWAAPGAATVYTLHHSKKTITFMSAPYFPNDWDAQECHRRIVVVAKALGWSVIQSK